MPFQGTIVRDRLAGPLRITEAVFAGHATLVEHRHDRPYVSCLLSGAYRERCGGAERHCTTGTVIWHAPGEVHEDVFLPGGGHLINIELGDAAPPALAPGVAPAPLAFRGGAPYAAALALYRALNSGRGGEPDLALGLLALAPAAGAPAPAWLRRAAEILHERSDGPLRLGEVAREVGVHPVHLSRTFRRVFGCAPRQWLGQARLRRAFDLIPRPDVTVGEVAAACGFADQAHLARSFRRATGLTPSAYRAVRAGARTAG